MASPELETNYFVCTLGQASRETQKERFIAVQDLLVQQAEAIPDNPAVAFASEAVEKQCLLSFSQVYKASAACARLLARQSNGEEAEGCTIALLCNSTPEFLLNWLALILLGHPALLIAPQCTPDAIAHLCTTCDAPVLLYDAAHENLAIRSSEAVKSNGRKLMVEPTVSCEASMQYSGNDILHEAKPDPKSVAYFHHTSGTSSGLPKPIPQSHHAAVGALPRLDGASKATFTTTPLYHGGIADLFRAWTSGAMIWLFPGDVPITATNIKKALDVVCRVNSAGQPQSLSYFSAVPYVLELMQEDESAMAYLSQVELVGVGGAALPKAVGDNMVEKGVRLVSRFGSAECGFLLSSHRLYEHDAEWQYLRVHDDQLRFEPWEDELYQLIVPATWPHVAKTNRPDGSFATGDLFEAHSSIPSAWRYHSRADSQLTLTTGKKFDPAPLEAVLAEASAFISDVLIFGNNRPYPGALLFRSEKGKNVSDSDVVNAIAKQVEILNSSSQKHVKLAPTMLVPMPFSDTGLPKSSKGSVLRSLAENQYEDIIQHQYANSVEIRQKVKDADVSRTLLALARTLADASSEFDEDSDLFSFGIDSVASIRMRRAILDLVPAETSDTVHKTIVEDCGTVNKLTDYVFKKRHGMPSASKPSQVQLMLDLVHRWGFNGSRASCNDNASVEHRGEVVVLTGATGFLGAFVFDEYRKRQDVRKIYCLVRGADVDAAYQRVRKSLRSRGLPESCPSEEKVVVLRTRLSDEKLGLDEATYRHISSEATIIAHLAWAVNFRISLGSFVRDHIAGLHNLLCLARQTPQARFMFCSSAASVANHELSVPVAEEFISDPSVAGNLGYSQSKWVAEQICMSAENAMKNRIGVFRVGQLSGDSRTGLWNASEAWPLLLSTVRLTQSLPALQDQPLDWLPVDLAARVFVEIASHRTHETPVYHLVNSDQTVEWNDLLTWLSDRVAFRIIEPTAWIEELETLDTKHNALALLEFWREMCETGTGAPMLDTTKTMNRSALMQSVKPVDQTYFEKLWHQIDSRSQ